MKTNISDLPKLLSRVFKAGHVSFISGSPGTSKSSVIAQLAKDNELELIDIRLSMMTPTSLNGFGQVNGDKSRFVPFEVFPLKGDELPKGKNGWILFLDEINAAPLSVQAAAYKLVLDRMVGDFELHEDVYIVAAGNLSTDGAIVNRMGTAMQSRLIHFEVELDSKAWITWANKNKVDFRIIAYIDFKPSVLSSFNPEHKDNTFACGRTLEFASDLIKDSKDLNHDDLVLLAGAIGEGNAKEFYSFTSIFEEMPTIADIKRDPENAKLANNPSFMFGVSSFVAEYVTENNSEQLFKYIERFSPEFQVVACRAIYKRNAEMCNNIHLIKLSNKIAVLME